MGMEVKIELGHKAWKNMKPTKEGYTHDWTVFVQGVNGNEIKHIVEKVIFHLPDIYPDPNRMFDKPPYALSESSSEGLSITIDVFFCSESNLKKVNYIYDVFIGDETVNISWERKLAFPNPSKEFKEKLLLAGGEVVDLLQAFPAMTGEVLKIKEEPVDETENVNVANEPSLNTTVNLDNLQNKGSTSSEEQLNFSDLLEENNKLKTANLEIKEKIDHQKQFMTYYKEHLSRYEKNISNANLGINQLKKKIESDKKEITSLKLQLQMLQVKNKLLQIQNNPTDLPEKSTRGTKRKNEEALKDTFGKEKENCIQPTKFASSCPSTSSNSSLFKNAFASIENQNVSETAKSNNAIPVVQRFSVKEKAAELNDLCNILLENSTSSHPSNETQSLNDNSSNQGQDSETPNCSNDVSSAVAFSLKSTNACNIEKSTERSSDKANTSLNKPSIKNKHTKKYANRSSAKTNAAKNIPEIITIDDEESTKGSSAKANGSKNTPEIITIDDEKSAKESSDEAVSLNTSDIMIIDNDGFAKGNPAKTNVDVNAPEIVMNAEKSTNEWSSEAYDSMNNDVEKHAHGSFLEENSSLNAPGMIHNAVKSANDADTSLNKFELRNNDGEKAVEGNSIEAHASTHMELCSTNRTQDGVGTPIQEQNVSSTERTDINSPKLNNSQGSKISKFGNVRISRRKARNAKTRKSHERRRFKKFKKHLELLERYSREVNYLHPEPSSANINSSNKENGEKIPNSGNVALNSRDTKISKRKKREDCVQNFVDFSQNQTACISSTSKESHVDSNNTSAPTFISFLTEHCQKLKTELDRIKNSEFSKYREGPNPLFHKLQNIDIHPVSNERFFQYVFSLIDYFSEPKTMDMPTAIYLIVDYLSRNGVSHESLITYFQNQDICVYLRASENCIVHALFEVERKALPHLNGLIRNSLNIIHQVIISKKKMEPNGLASLCRVFMEICKCNSDRWQPLYLCCELLRLGNPLAPYLINSLAAVWRNPFTLCNNFSVVENMVLGSIHYGMKSKPLLMDCDLWRLTLRLQSTYFPRPFFINPHQAIQFLTNEIFSRCSAGLFQDLWMLASPLIIFVSKETWNWKRGFRNNYLVSKLLHFSMCANEPAFGLFCNLYVDIFNFRPEATYNQVLQYFTNSGLHKGVKCIQDCAAVAVLKCLGTADKPIPALLRDWLLQNQDNPKLAVLIDLYLKKVMETHDSCILWDDIIILQI